MTTTAPAINRPPPLLALIIPCYNESEILAESMAILGRHLAQWKQERCIDEKSFACYIDDGSTDHTWQILTASAAKDCHAIKLGYNCGTQKAIFAGIVYASTRSDCCITLDADMQDDITVIPEMLMHYRSGCEVVYGVRSDRSSDSWTKRVSANAYYYIAQKLGVADIPNHSDFRLMSRLTMSIVREFREHHLYLRGIVLSLKLPVAQVLYKRKPRIGGQTKYSTVKLITLALNAILSFSTIPLRLVTLLGLIISTASFGFICKAIYDYYVHGPSLTGWTSLLVSIYFLGGLMMLSLGIVGEYIGRIFIESKKRPMYFIEQKLDGSPPPAEESEADKPPLS